MATKRSERKQPRSGGRGWPLKLTAVTVFAAAAGLLYYLTHLPAAIDLRSLGAVEVRLAEVLVMTGPDPADRLLAYQGALGETVDVRFERARLHPDTLAALNALGLRPPADAGPIAWITRQGKDTQTFINMRIDSASAPQAQISLAPSGTTDHPALRLGVGRAPLEVEMGVPLGDTAVDGDSPKRLDVQNFSIASLPGSFALKIIVPEQSQFSLQFGAHSSASSWRAGEQEISAPGGPGLALKALGIKQIAASGFDLAMCAAPRGTVAWLARGVDADNCAAAHPSIRIMKIEPVTDTLKLTLAGSAFVAKDGVAVSDEWYEKLENNKLISALLGLVYAALAGWVWKVFSGAKK